MIQRADYKAFDAHFLIFYLISPSFILRAPLEGTRISMELLAIFSQIIPKALIKYVIIIF